MKKRKRKKKKLKDVTFVVEVACTSSSEDASDCGPRGKGPSMESRDLVVGQREQTLTEQIKVKIPNVH